MLALALMLALGGCGGDEEEPTGSTGTETAQTATESEPGTDTTETSETAPAPTAEEPPDGETATSPESQPGGAGDEEAARTLALFTADGGRIRPRRIRVPAFISIRVELRSADGRRYGLTFAGKTIAVGGGLGSMSTTLAGLRPGTVLVGTPTGAGNPVRIEATAEPGP